MASHTPLAQTMVATESHHHRLAEGITTSRVSVYREALSPRDVELFEWVAGDTLSRYGYGRDYPDPRGPTLREKLAAWYVDQPRRMAIKYVREPRYLPMVALARVQRMKIKLRAAHHGH